MILYPAIDLKDGQCVRLLRGDMAAATRLCELALRGREARRRRRERRERRRADGDRQILRPEIGADAHQHDRQGGGSQDARDIVDHRRRLAVEPQVPGDADGDR